jgi:hypothetical protein
MYVCMYVRDGIFKQQNFEQRTRMESESSSYDLEGYRGYKSSTTLTNQRRRKNNDKELKLNKI